MQLPRVSVVIVNYNGYRWFKLFIDSLIRTNYPDFEIIVVDNASSDQSIQYLNERTGNIKTIELGENRGYAQAANIGASHATGEILAFVNNDMEFHSDWLINGVNKLLSNDCAAAAQCKILTYSNKQKIDCIGLSVDRYNLPFLIGRFEIDHGQYDKLSEIGACSGGAMIIWKKIFQEVGAFDPTYFMFYEDIDLSWRIRMSGFQIFPAHSSVVYHVGSATVKDMNSSDEGNISPFFAFHVAKNYIYCWLKNSSLKVVILYWPVVLLIILARIAYQIRRRRAAVVLAQIRGMLWNIRHVGFVVRQRAKIKKLRKIPSEDILLKRENGSTNLLTWIQFSRHVAKKEQAVH